MRINKFRRYLKKYGLARTLKLTVSSVAKKTHRTHQPINVMVDIEDIIKADYINRPYQTPPAINKTKLKIAWVLSPLGHGSGGQTTITRFARFLQQQGHEITFYIYEAIHPQSVAEAKKLLINSFKLNVSVKQITDYEESDALIATGWETAYPVFNTTTKAHKFYFVQDFEPYFYGLGSRAVLAENTYKMGFYGITAGKWLAHKVNDYGMKADYFNFGADLDIYKLGETEKFNKQKKIAFYARPVTERRAFELGVITLDIFHKKHPEYTIEFFGWDVSDFKIPFPYVNRGILSHDRLAELYQQSTACLVLSLTNVSLLPLELLAAGCIPVMNQGDNNTMVLGKNNNIRYAEASPVQLANQLSIAVEAADLPQRARRASESVKDLDWADSYKKVETILIREVTGKSGKN